VSSKYILSSTFPRQIAVSISLHTKHHTHASLFSDPDLYRLLKFQIPNPMSILRCLRRATGSIQSPSLRLFLTFRNIWLLCTMNSY
jgi:hypothetical protein